MCGGICFAHVISLSPAFFETARTGDLMARMTADVEVLQTLVGSAISMWLRNVLLLIGALALLIATSVKLAVIIVVVVPFVMVPVLLFGRREKRLSRVAQDRIGDLGAYAQETLAALPTVQAYTHEGVDRRIFASRVEDSVAAAVRRIRTRALLILVVILLGFGAITFSLWVGGRDVIAGRMTGGDLAAFVFYAVMLATSGATLSELWGEVQRAAGAAERLAELMAERPTIAAPAHDHAVSACCGRNGGVRRCRLQLPVAAGRVGPARASASGWRQARRWPSSVPPARARPRSFSSCCGSTT